MHWAIENDIAPNFPAMKYPMNAHISVLKINSQIGTPYVPQIVVVPSAFSTSNALYLPYRLLMFEPLCIYISVRNGPNRWNPILPSLGMKNEYRSQVLYSFAFICSIVHFDVYFCKKKFIMIHP